MVNELCINLKFRIAAKTISPNNTAWLNNRYAPGASGYGHNPDGRNKRSVWTIPTQPVSYAHFACFPEKLIEPMILAGCPEGGIVLDPFMGSGTTAAVAERLGRRWQGCELNPEYIEIIKRRLEERGGALEHLPMFAHLEAQ